MKLSVRLIVAGDIQWPQTALLKCSGIRELEYPRRYKYYANAPHCNVILRCLSYLFHFSKYWKLHSVL